MSNTDDEKEKAVALTVNRETIEMDGIILETGKRYDLVIVEQSETLSE